MLGSAAELPYHPTPTNKSASNLNERGKTQREVRHTITSNVKYFFKFLMIITRKGNFMPSVFLWPFPWGWLSPGHVMYVVLKAGNCMNVSVKYYLWLSCTSSVTWRLFPLFPARETGCRCLLSAWCDHFVPERPAVQKWEEADTSQGGRSRENYWTFLSQIWRGLLPILYRIERNPDWNVFLNITSAQWKTSTAMVASGNEHAHVIRQLLVTS